MIVCRQPALGLFELTCRVGQMALAVEFDKIGVPVAIEARAEISAASRSPPSCMKLCAPRTTFGCVLFESGSRPIVAGAGVERAISVVRQNAARTDRPARIEYLAPD